MPKVDIANFLDARPLSNFQRVVIALCFLILLIDGFDMAAIGFLAPAIREEWGLAQSDLGPLFASGLSGLVVGAFLFGPIADRIGRKKVLLICLMVFGLATLCCAAATGIGQLSLFRFIAGIGFGGALPNAITLTSEYTPQRRRGFLVTGMNCGFTIGAALGGVVTAHMIGPFGWRGVLLLGGIVPLALVPLMIWQLPESIRFLVAKGGGEQRVQSLLRRVAPSEDLSGMRVVSTAQEAKPSLRSLFAAGLGKSTVLLWTAFFCSMLVIYLLSSWLPTFIRNTGASLESASLVTAMFQIGGTLGAISLGAAMDRVRPQTVLTVAYLAAAGFIALIGLSITQHNWAAAVIFAAGFFLSGGQTAANAFSARIYPLGCRATGVGTASSLGRIGSVTGSLAGAALAGMPLQILFLFVAVPVVVAAGCFYALRASDQID